MNYVKSLVLIILITISVSGCTIRIKMNESNVRNLTEDEIITANEHFAPFKIDKDGRISSNSISHFFTSFYDDPKDINIAQFLRYFEPSVTVTDIAEFNALKEHEKWFFPKDITFDKMPVPIHRIPLEDFDHVLKMYAGIGFQELNMVGFDDPELIFLEEYDAFYNFTSDFAAGTFSCVRGEVEENIVRLYSCNDVMLTLEKREDSYFINSHQIISIQLPND